VLLFGGRSYFFDPFSLIFLLKLSWSLIWSLAELQIGNKRLILPSLSSLFSLFWTGGGNRGTSFELEVIEMSLIVRHGLILFH